MATIRKRGTKYQVVIRKKGTQVSKSFTLKADGLKWSREVEISIENNTYNPKEIKITVFKELLDKYLSTVSIGLKSYPVEKYKIPLISNRLGYLKLSEVSTVILVDYRDMRLNEVSSQTVKHELGIIRRILKKGMEWGYISSVPYIAMPSIKGTARSRRLADEEMDKLLSSCTPLFKLIVTLLINTGMRRGELIKISIEDIDLENKLLTLYDTKNGEDRTIPLSSTAINVINSLISLSTTNILVDLKPDLITKTFQRTCKKAGIEDYRLHDLRHEAISRLFERGLNMMEVSTISGHKDLASLKRYTHINPISLLSKIE